MKKYILALVSMFMVCGCSSNNNDVGHVSEGLQSCVTTDNYGSAYNVRASGRYLAWNAFITGTNYDIITDNTRSKTQEDLGATNVTNDSNTEFAVNINRTNPKQIVFQRSGGTAGLGEAHFIDFQYNRYWILWGVAGSSGTVSWWYQTPAIDGSYMTYIRVLQDTSTGVIHYDLWLVSFNAATDDSTFTQLTNDARVRSNPQIYGDYIVYEDSTSGSTEIWMYKISTNTSSKIANSPAYTPDIDGDRVVYQSQDLNGINQVSAYTISTAATQQLTTGSSVKSSPRISGDKVVWTQTTSGNSDVYSYDFSTSATTAIATGTGNQLVGDVSGDMVVFTTPYGSFNNPVTYTFGDTACTF